MTPVNPSLPADGRYEVSKIAKALDVSRQSVYNYSKEGLITLRTTRPKNGRKPKLFAYGREVNRLWERIVN